MKKTSLVNKKRSSVYLTIGFVSVKEVIYF